MSEWMKRIIHMDIKKEMQCKNKITVQYIKFDNENLFWKTLKLT